MQSCSAQCHLAAIGPVPRQDSGACQTSRENLYTPPPPLPHFWPKAFFRRGGWGCIFWGPTRQEFYTPPLFIRPPRLGGYFQGWGGVGVYKIWPRKATIDEGQIMHRIGTQPVSELYAVFWCSWTFPVEIAQGIPQHLCSCKKGKVRQGKENKLKLLGPDIFRWGWGPSTWRGGGQKFRYVPRNPRRIFLAVYFGILAGISRGLRNFEKKVCVQILAPLNREEKTGKPEQPPPPPQKKTIHVEECFGERLWDEYSGSRLNQACWSNLRKPGKAANCQHCVYHWACALWTQPNSA